MSIHHIHNGEDFWRGIRDGGSRERRMRMYAFLAKHKNGKGIRLHDKELRHMYDVCLRTARELSRAHNWQKPG